MFLSLPLLVLLQLSIDDVRQLAPPAEGERWPALEIRAAVPVPVWTVLGFRPGDKVVLFNAHPMDVTTSEAFYAWSVSPSTTAGIAVRSGRKIRWMQHRVGRGEEPRFRSAMRGEEMVGVELVSVPSNAYWASAGLQAGDIIVAVNGIALIHPMALLVAFNSPDQKFRIRRGDKEFDLTSLLAEAPIPSTDATRP